MKAALAFVLLLAFGCSSEEDLTISGGGGADASPIVGTWESACALSGSVYDEVTLVFSADGVLTITSNYFSDATCDTETYTSTEVIDYWLIRQVSSEDEKYQWNWESQTLAYKPTEAQAETWNTSGFCDYADWLAEETFDRTDKDCHYVELVYDLLKIEDDNLFLGDRSSTNNGTTNDKRPIVVSAKAYVRK